jgi:hypothetical protein
MSGWWLLSVVLTSDCEALLESNVSTVNVIEFLYVFPKGRELWKRSTSLCVFVWGMCNLVLQNGNPFLQKVTSGVPEYARSASYLK